MLNETVLQGRLTRDPELRTTPSGVPVCSFTVAWSEKYKDVETQLFLDCTAWRGTGELVNKYFRKGQEIIVEGKLHTEKWTDNNGNNRTSIKMTADKVHFCGPKQDSESSNSFVPAGKPVSVDVSDDEFSPFDDLPDDMLPF